jgi:hypothetical protein
VSLAVWAIARRLKATRAVALVAGLLGATSGTVLWTTGQVTADGIAVACMTWALWATLVYRDDPGPGRAAGVGVLLGAAFAVKPLVGTALVPLVWWMYERRRPRDLAIVGVTTAAVWFATALPWGLGRVWDQSIAYHLGKGPEYTKLHQLGKLTSLVPLRDGIVVLAAALGVIAVLTGACRSRTRHSDVVVIAVWIAFTAFVLVFEKALFANHLVNMVVPLLVLFAARPPPLRWLAIGLVVAIPWSLWNLTHIFTPLTYGGAEAALVRDLRALPDDARAIADDPAFVWRAGLSTPAMMNDVSKMRVDQDDLTTADVVTAARDGKTCAVVIWTFRFGSLLPGVREQLQASGYRLAREYAPSRELWLKDPGGAPACRAAAAEASGRSPG